MASAADLRGSCREDSAAIPPELAPEPGGLPFFHTGAIMGAKLDSAVPEALGFDLLSPWVFRLFPPLLFVQVRAWQDVASKLYGVDVADMVWMWQLWFGCCSCSCHGLYLHA